MLAGLSPRVRGNPAEKLLALLIGGPIPACAGQPCPVGWYVTPAGAYPRVCGATLHKRSRAG